MAARPGQGLQAAVIVFAMLTIILSITTYMFWAQSQTAIKEREAANKQKTDLQTENNKLLYRVKALKYTLGIGGITRPDLDLAQNSAGGEDTEVKEILAKYDSDMLLVGDQAAADEAKNYGSMAKILLTALQKKNASLADLNDQIRKTQQDKAAAEDREKKRADAAETNVAKSNADLEKAIKDNSDDRTKREGDNAKLQTQLADKDKEASQKLDAEKKNIDTLTKDKQQLQTKNDQQKKQLIEIKLAEQGLFENPDGRIILVNQQQQLVWINVGRLDGLLRQTTFSVYDHKETGFASTERKGRIEVVQVTGDHQAEARIVEDTVTNPILPGDIIQSPAWSPGQQIHFAMRLKMDVNNDKVDDFDLVKNVILLNGGVIDAELRADGTRSPGKMTVNTRYLVDGELPTDKSTAALIPANNEMEKERVQLGIEKIPVQKLLAMMGWKAEERTVVLGGNRGSEFRKRTPAGKAPPVAAPAGATTPGGATGTPPAEGTTPPAAAPAADPFAAPAAPAAAPAPAAAADPFAAPPK